ncbi:MAG: hypothetical protein C0P75_008680 [Bacilli bacterium]|uniref:hypothetical protein n=1 Tax=Ureibacillus sp. FSL W7-1570 TaxID=2954593 RepID=UPI001EB9EC27|nr:hypothetical protein [Bacilli bacterium]
MLINNSKQNEIVAKLMNELEIMDGSEFEDLYNQLDIAHQTIVDAALREYVDCSLSDAYWSSVK